MTTPLLALIILAALSASSRADVFRWNDGELIPGTEGITPGPGVMLDHRQLEYANLPVPNLTASVFEFSNLSNARLFGANLTNANFAEANLTNADLSNAKFTNAKMTGATVIGADFTSITPRGPITAAQFYSTQSYQVKQLAGINMFLNDLSGWDFRGQDLTNAGLGNTSLRDANLTQATLTNSYLANSSLAHASLIGANLTDARLPNSVLTLTDMTGAIVNHAQFDDTTSSGFTPTQLYSTHSYQAKSLTGIRLANNNLSNWDLHDQNLSNANLNSSTLTNVNLMGANLRNTNLLGPMANGLTSVRFSPDTVYSQWTQFPNGFSPAASGLTYRHSSPGDLDANDALDVSDVEMLQLKLRFTVLPRFDWLPSTMFDINNDHIVSLDDVATWVKDVKQTYFGDANLDGEFNSSDLVQVFAAGTYETRVNRNAIVAWAAGDWNTDGKFTTSDLVAAFQDGGYEAGPRTVVASVPEPNAFLQVTIGLIALMRRRLVQFAHPGCR